MATASAAPPLPRPATFSNSTSSKFQESQLRKPTAYHPPLRRRPWITATVITHLVRTTKTQHLLWPNFSLPDEFLQSLQSEWHHIVHDTFSHFQTKMACLDCGHLIEWCNDQGVAWFLESLRRDMDGTDAWDVDEELAEKWDRGFEKIVPMLLGRREGKCWLLEEDGEGMEGMEGMEGGGVGRVNGGDADGNEDWNEDEEEEVGSEGVIEGLEAMQLLGGDGFTAEGFVHYSRPLWGSVVDEPLDIDIPCEEDLDESMEGDDVEGTLQFQPPSWEKLAVGGSERDASPSCGSVIYEAFDENIPDEESLFGDPMDQNSEIGEHDDEEIIDITESILEDKEILIENNLVKVQDNSLSEDFHFKEPAASTGGDFHLGFMDSDDGSMVDGGESGVKVLIDDSSGEVGRDDDNEGSDLGSEREEIDQAGYASEAVVEVGVGDGMEIDFKDDSDAETEVSDVEDCQSEADQDTQADVQMDDGGLVGPGDENEESNPEFYYSEAEQDGPEDDSVEINGVLDPISEIEESEQDVSDSDSDPEIEVDNGTEAAEDAASIEEIDKGTKDDSNIQVLEQIQTIDEMDVWGDIYQHAGSLKSEDNEFNFENFQQFRPDDDSEAWGDIFYNVYDEESKEEGHGSEYQQTQTRNTMEFWGKDNYVGRKSERNEDDHVDDIGNVPTLPTGSGANLDGGVALDAGSEKGDDDDENGEPENALGFSMDDERYIEGCIDLDEEREDLEDSKERDEAAYHARPGSEGIQPVQKGYGAQFQGQRVYRSDESDESEEE